MLVPSKETSLEANLPVESSKEAKIIANMLRKLRALDLEDKSDSDEHTGSGPSPPDSDNEPSVSEEESASDVVTKSQGLGDEPGPSTSIVPMRSTHSSSTKPTQIDVLKEAVSALKKTNIAYLATHTPVTSSDTMPKTATRTTAQLYTVPNTTAATLTIEPKTQNEVYLLAALHEAENRNARNEVYQYKLQASNILNEAYTERLRKALETKEEKRSKRGTTKLVGDGLPRVLCYSINLLVSASGWHPRVTATVSLLTYDFPYYKSKFILDSFIFCVSPARFLRRLAANVAFFARSHVSSYRVYMGESLFEI